MALKSNVVVQHLILAGTKEELDNQVTGLLNIGWEILEAKMIMFDAYNQIIQVFYIMSKKNKNE